MCLRIPAHSIVCVCVCLCVSVSIHVCVFLSTNVCQIHSNEVITSLSLMFHKRSKRPHSYHCLSLTLLISRCRLQTHSQASQAISTANLMDCYISHLNPVLSLVTLSVRIDCKRGIYKTGPEENYKPRNGS